MSIKHMNLVFRNRELTGNTRLTLLALADNASDEGYCWPAYDTIAKKVNITRRSAMRIIISLERAGYLTRVERHKETGDRDTNGFQLSESVMIAQTWGVVTEESPGVVSVPSPPSDRTVTRVVTEESPKSLINHHLTNEEVIKGTRTLTNLYENNIGLITMITADIIKEAAEVYPESWFEPAFKEMIKNNVRNWNYIESILARWAREGFGSDGRQKAAKIKRETGDNLQSWAERKLANGNGQ